MSTIWLKMLGGFHGHDDDGQRLQLTSRKAIALLSYVTLKEGAEVERDHLTALLWQESDQSRARGMLRQTLTALQNHLPDGVLIVNPESVQVDPELVHADVLGLRTAFKGSTGALFDAFQLYRGELLEGLDARADAFDNWLVTEREQLHSRVMDRMHELLEELLLQKSTRHSIELAVRILSLDPGDEETHRRLIRLYTDAGRQSAALHQFEVCKHSLAGLGQALSPETIALGKSLGRADQTGVGGGEGEMAPIPPNEPVLRDAVVLHGAIKSFHEDGDEFLLRAPSLHDWVSALANLTTRLGGALLRQDDDAVLAAFGLKRFADCAEERAARTAVAIRHRLSHMLPDHIDVAIGLASGQAMVTADGDTLQLVGDVQTRAARLGELADAAEVVVDASMASALPDSYELAETGYPIPSRNLMRFSGSHSLEGQYTWAHGQVSARSDIRGAWLDAATEHLRLIVDNVFEAGEGAVVVVRGHTANEHLNALAADAEQSGMLVHRVQPADSTDISLSPVTTWLQLHAETAATADESLAAQARNAAAAVPRLLIVPEGAELSAELADAVRGIATDVTPHERFVLAIGVLDRDGAAIELTGDVPHVLLHVQ